MSELNNKTLNPSEKKGSVKLTEEEIQALKDCYANSNIRKHHELIESALAKLQANGETPEEVNPVGQISEHNILDMLPGLEQALGIYDYNKHRLQLYAHLAYSLNLLLTNKPLETTKEQPSYYFYRIEFTNEKLQRETLCGTLSSDANPIETFENFKRLHNNKLQLSILNFNLIG